MATANLLQTSVSGGTQNALSLQGDGVFFPKASTASRLALTLTTTDKGFIVYDTTDNNIYFWNGAAWESVPSSGDAGANGSVQYNDNGIVSGATNFVYNKATSAVSVAGDLTVDTSTLKVDSTANSVGIGTASPSANTLTIGASRFILCSDSQSKFGDSGIINGGAADANTQIQFFGGKSLFFNEGASNTKMTLNSTGLGIGASPAVLLDIQSASAVIRATSSTGTNTSFAAFANTGGAVRVGAENSAGGGLFTGSSAYSAVLGTTGAYSAHIGTNGVVRATVDASGNLLVGDTSSPIASRVSLFTTFAQPDGIVIRNTGATAGLYWRFGAVNNSNTLFVMNASSVGVTMADGASAWSAVSDERFKDIIEPISNAVSKVGSLRSVIGKYKSDSEGTRRSFLIAQDVKSVLPEAVDSTDSESLGLRYTEVIPLLVAAIQELTARVQTLEAR